MNGSGVRAAVEVLVGTELSVADHASLADASRAVARLSSFVDLAKVQIARRGRELAEQGDSSSAHALIDDAGCTGRDVNATNGRDRVCGTVPGFEDALANGDVSGAHLDSLAQHTKGLSDEERSDVAAIADELLDAAVSQHPGLFDRTVKDRIDTIRNSHRPDTAAEELERQRQQSSVKRWTDRGTGMRNTMISLDPIRDETLWNTIDAHLATLRHEPANAARPFGELQVEALMAAVSSPAGRRVPEIVVHVDDATLCHGHHDDSLCETADGRPVPGVVLERLCCEAVLQAVVKNPDGTIDRLCAEHRTANRQQRRMLEAMYSTCAHPHCTVPFSACRIHHIVWWTRGGTTVMANLLPLCEAHHHLVHEGGWSLEIDDQRQVTWTRPDGTVWCTTRPNRRPDQRPPAECERPPSLPPDSTRRPAGTRPDRPPGPITTPPITAEQTTLL